MSAVSVANRESPASRAAARPRALSLSLAVVAALTVLGLAIRIANFDQSLLGDELSSYWVIKGHSFGHMLSILRSDAEITPPLFFVFAWLSSKLGSNPDLIRLPSLIAGTATIPLVYVLGSRTVGRTAGLIGAAVMALSPYMIYYSVEARSYAVMIALVTASTVALLAALRTGRGRWWAIYAACSLGAVSSHCTCRFPLAAQCLWVLWAHREAFRPLLVANLAVLIGFAPWIPGFLADSNSPTTQILYALQPFTFDYVRATLETWAMGYPYVVLGRAPGDLAVAMIATGVLVAACAVGLSWVRSRRSSSRRPSERLPSGLVLVAMLALAAPLGEAIVAAI